MKQQPSRLKFKKNHKAKASFFFLKAGKNFLPVEGRFALKSQVPGKITFNQLEAGRKSIRRNVSKQGFLRIGIFTAASVTRKSIGLRMGKGKGNHAFWMCPIRAGHILYELGGVPFFLAFKALRRASKKMPLKTSLVKLIF